MAPDVRKKLFRYYLQSRNTLEPVLLPLGILPAAKAVELNHGLGFPYVILKCICMTLAHLLYLSVPVILSRVQSYLTQSGDVNAPSCGREMLILRFLRCVALRHNPPFRYYPRTANLESLLL
jgi:hypothetical protein